MRKLLLSTSFLILFLNVGSSLQAQSLAFSQVRFLEYDLTISSGTFNQTIGSSTLVVPAGKVLKITSLFSGYTISTIPRPLNGIETFEFYLNGKSIHQNEPSSTSYPLVQYPIWLPAGSYDLKYFYDSGSSSSLTYVIKWGLSAIEFDVVP